jgi:radical SAM protein with 4Fe4S-binding SPASM domain
MNFPTKQMKSLTLRTKRFFFKEKIGCESDAPHLHFDKLFLPDRWAYYTRRKNLLLSPDPKKWDLIDFPLEVSLELTNYCNVRCVICPVPNLRRKRGFVDEAVFKRIVEDISCEAGFLFLPQGFGELLLHGKCFQLLDFAHSMKIQPISVVTNGMLLHEKNILRLINTVDGILVTIDGITAKTYESIRVNSSFEKVTKNVEKFLEIRGDKESPHLVLRIIKMKETEEEIRPFYEHWSKKIGKGDMIHVAHFNDWAGSVKDRSITNTPTPRDRRPCRRLWNTLIIYYDGRVSPCCFDAEGDLIVGDILNQRLKEIWNGTPLRNLRDLHYTHHFKDIPLCSKCRHWF